MELDGKKVSGTANTHSELWVLWQLYGQATGGETEAGQCQACGSAYAEGLCRCLRQRARGHFKRECGAVTMNGTS